MAGAKKSILALIPTPLRAKGRGAYIRVRRLLFPVPPAEIEISSFGGSELAYRKHTVDENVIRKSLSSDYYMSDITDYSPSSKDIVIDVGAHIGTFALQISSKVSEGKVYALEACKETFNLLRINAALNRSANVEPHHLALSDRKGTCRLSHSGQNWGFSIVRSSKNGEEVQTQSLQGFMDQEGLSSCQLLKMNCEGAEFPILLSSNTDTLQMFDRMVIRYHLDLWKQNTKEQLAEHLRSSGFEVKVHESSEKRGTIIAARREMTGNSR